MVYFRYNNIFNTLTIILFQNQIINNYLLETNFKDNLLRILTALAFGPTKNSRAENDLSMRVRSNY